MRKEERRGYSRGATVLSLGIGAGGVLTYAYFALASNILSPDEYGGLTVLWSILFVSVVTLYRPVEQFVSRSLAEHETRGESTGHSMRVAATIQLLLAVAFVAAALVFRGPIEDDLLHGQADYYWILLVAAPAYAVSFFARGYLAGRGRFGLYGAMLLLESSSRFAMAAIVAIGLLSGSGTVASGILLAPLVSLVVVPLVGFRRSRSDGGDDPAPPLAASTTSMSRGGRFVGAAFLIMLSEQALLNAGVLIVAADLDAAAAGFLFNVLLVARAPQVLFGAVTTSLLPTLSRLQTVGDAAARATFRSHLSGTIRIIGVAAATLATAILIGGPQLMQLTFGDDFTYDRVGLLIVVTAMGFHLTALTLTQVALAREREGAAAARWAACAVAFVGISLSPGFEPIRQVEVAYATAMAALTLLLVCLWRKTEASD